VDQAATDAQQDASAAAASARSKWTQMKTDAAAKMDDLQARIDKRAGQIDANVAADDAAWAEDDAAAAIDYASWTVDNARLAVLDAIDARVYADELANRAGAEPRPRDPSRHGPAVPTDRRAVAMATINPGTAVQQARSCAVPAGACRTDAGRGC
jgi:glycerol-3-phosphate dehydrogenase